MIIIVSSSQMIFQDTFILEAFVAKFTVSHLNTSMLIGNVSFDGGFVIKLMTKSTLLLI